MEREKLFELSGEHEDLAAAEVGAAADAEGLELEVSGRSEGLLVAETGSGERFARLGLCHRVLEFLGAYDDPGRFEPELSLDATFRVRARRVRDGRRDLSLSSVEEVVGSKLVEIGGTVDLDDPEREFRAILSGDKVFVGETILEIDRSFASKRPHQRPFFHPGTVEPVTARAMVNLARTRDSLFNPMCGSGSLMLEGARVGAFPSGLDAEPAMVRGSLLNLKEEGFEGETMMGDARSLPLVDGCFHSVVADLPYGRSTKIYGEDLYDTALLEMVRVSEEGGYVVIAAPRALEGADQRYELRVHRSLSRVVNVFEG